MKQNKIIKNLKVFHSGNYSITLYKPIETHNELKQFDKEFKELMKNE